MCQFASWVTYKDKTFFLTDKKLASKEGVALKKYLTYPSQRYFEDIKGHGAIRSYHYELKNQGKYYENDTFKDPKDYPKELVKAIKELKLTKIGYSLNLLNNKGQKLFDKIEQSALAEYQKIKQSAYAEYQKIEQPALAEYQKIEQPALVEYQKIKQSAYAEYQKIEQPAYAEYQKIEQPAYAEYQKIKQSALAEYQKIEQPAYAEYQKIEQSALAEYQKIKQSAYAEYQNTLLTEFWKIFKIKRNRNPKWR